MIRHHDQRGIASALLRAGLQGLRDAGIDKCHLLVFHDNAEGLAFSSQQRRCHDLELELVQLRQAAEAAEPEVIKKGKAEKAEEEK